MDPITAKLMSAAGAAADKVYVDDVFSTYLHAGENSSSTINNGIDLSGEGGLVWVKTRDNTYSHFLFDTERGTTKTLSSNLTNAEFTESKGVTAFNSNGFTIGGSGGDIGFNGSGTNYAYWTFRKAPGFFDVVTYTGNSTPGRQIAHNLEATPTVIWVKCISDSTDWVTYWSGVGPTQTIPLNKQDGAGSLNVWNSTSPTSTHVTVSARLEVNRNDKTYVMYLFAGNEAVFGTDGNEPILKDGLYTGNGAASGQKITLGFEPQYLMIKNIEVGAYGNWQVFDNMRGIPTSGNDALLAANSNGSETSSASIVDLNSDGFTVFTNEANYNNYRFVYMAIRRPHKPPEAGTDVFKPELLTSQTQVSTPGFAPDSAWQIWNRSYPSFYLGSRLTGNGKYLTTFNGNAEGSFTSWKFDAPTGKFTQSLSTGSTSGGIQYFFKRAPKFFDIVAYTGVGYARSVEHNLTVTPEMIWVKKRNASDWWGVYHASQGSSKEAYLNDPAGTAPFATGNSIWYTNPVPTVFYVNSDNQVNKSGDTYIAYLFATLPGISKVGSYTGTGTASNINVDCGFTAGARFVLIKRADGTTGPWYQWDSARGIVAGNDPFVYLNSTAAEVTNQDYIDPFNAGFTVDSGAPSYLNLNGGTYIFLAIA